MREGRESDQQHARNVFLKLGLDTTSTENRRVTAVLTYLGNAAT